MRRLVMLGIGLTFLLQPSQARPQAKPAQHSSATASGFPATEEARIRPALYVLTQEQRQLAQKWLYMECAVNSVEIMNSVQQMAPVLEPVFWEAFSYGPPEKDLGEYRDHLLALRGPLRESLQTKAAQPLLGDTTPESVVARFEEDARYRVEQIQVRYRQSALSGLGLVCSRSCEIRLTHIAKADRSPVYRAAAQSALSNIRRREGSKSNRGPKP